MQHLTRIAIALLCFSYPLSTNAEDDAVLTPDSTGQLVFCTLSEYQFYPLAGTFRVLADGVRLSNDPESVHVMINNLPLPAASVHAGDQELRVDYRFAPGLNEVQISGQDRDGGYLQTDALIWAGSRLLAIDVMDHAQHAIDDAIVTVMLAEQPTVKSQLKTVGGSAYLDNLPAAALSITVRFQDQNVRKIVAADSNYVSISLNNQAQVVPVESRKSHTAIQ